MSITERLKRDLIELKQQQQFLSPQFDIRAVILINYIESVLNKSELELEVTNDNS